MKRLLIIAAIVASTVPAHAISRYESMSLTCASAQQRIQNEGAVILRYPSKRVANLTLFDRYVAHGGWCETSEYAKLEVVPTADNGACRVLKCFPKVFKFD